MSFAKYIAGDVLLFLLAVLTLPLWLPFYAFGALAGWLAHKRWQYELDKPLAAGAKEGERG